jgi:hypothetical protein
MAITAPTNSACFAEGEAYAWHCARAVIAEKDRYIRAQAAQNRKLKALLDRWRNLAPNPYLGQEAATNEDDEAFAAWKKLRRDLLAETDAALDKRDLTLAELATAN